VKLTLCTALSGIALCLGLATPFAAWSADAVAPAASNPTKAKKVAKMPKAKGTHSAPGCDESNSPGKKMPNAPKCPEKIAIQPGAKQ
jgi:hypothetical protein